MSYVFGFVAAVPNENREAYVKHVETAAEVVMELGATRYVECWGDNVPEGKITSFPMAVKRRANETVCLGWVEWPSKEACDEGMQKMMEDPRLAPEALPMPFDTTRIVWGGFDVILDR